MSSNERRKTWQRRMDEAKQKHRPSLKNWSRDGFATTRYQEFLNLRELDSKYPGLPIIDVGDVDVKSFRREFEVPYKPCIINRIPEVEGWSAVNNWTFSALKSQYKERMFKVGEDDDGYKVKTKLGYFLKYMKKNQDDSPLYIFDGAFDNDSVAKCILGDYQVPSFFKEDLFKLVGEERRPPYRWFLVGPERSGTSIHLDPLGTSAWNTLLVGHKRWVFFPPETEKRVAKGLTVIKKGEDDESINYFVDLLPRIKEQYPELPIYEAIQRPGETIFVPGGWWHAVLNLDHTIAITQNFCSSANFDDVWRATRKGRKKMAVKWLRKLRSQVPNLAVRAEELNAQDQFVMYDQLQKEKEKGKEKEKEKEHSSKKNKKEKEEDRTDNDSSDKHSEQKTKKKKKHKSQSIAATSSSSPSSSSKKRAMDSDNREEEAAEKRSHKRAKVSSK